MQHDTKRGAMQPEIQARIEELRSRITALAPGLIALSGGVDSRLLTHLAALTGQRFEAVHFSGPHVPAAETALARSWCAEQGLPLHVLEIDPLAHPEVAANAPLRCYHCKYLLFSRARELARSRGLATLLDGSNASDQSAHRPGLQALAELDVRGPLAAAGVDKAMVRAISRELGLAGWDAPARPCLLTRFAYGLRPDAATLRRLAAAEAALAGLGFREFRLRVPRTGTMELHLADAERGLWETRRHEAGAALGEILGQPPEPVWPEVLSGVYDQRQR